MQINLSKGNSVISLSLFLIINIKAIMSESMDKSEKVLLRERRQLLFPNSTLLQFNAGLTTHTPVQDRAILVNWAFQANFQLPWNRTQIPTDVLLVGPGYTEQARAHRTHKAGVTADDDFDDNHQHDFENDKDFKTSQEETENIENNIEIDQTGTNNIGTEKDIRINSRIERVTNEEVEIKKGNKKEPRSERDLKKQEYSHVHTTDDRYHDEVKLHHIYRYLDEFLTGFGHNGTSCVLLALCQLAAEPLYSEDDEDLIHELSQYLLDISADQNGITEESLPYLQAQSLGRQQAKSCDAHYPNCGISLVDMFTRVHFNE